MRFFFSILLVCCLCGAGPLLMLQAHAQTIHLKTENYPPFNMVGAGDSIIGISTEIVETLFKRAGVDYTLELLPWQRAFSLALNEQDNAVFSTTRTAQREEKFKWVGPLVKNNWVFLAKKSRNISVQNLEEGKDYRVGGYQGDATALYLIDQGYQMGPRPEGRAQCPENQQGSHRFMGNRSPGWSLLCHAAGRYRIGPGNDLP